MEGFPVTQESRSVFAEMFDKGVGLRQPGIALGKPWNKELFNNRMEALPAYKDRSDTTKDRQPDRKSFENWRDGKSPGKFYAAVITGIFLGTPPACSTQGKTGGAPSSGCLCEPCTWRGKLEGWLKSPAKQPTPTEPETGAHRRVPYETASPLNEPVHWTYIATKLDRAPDMVDFGLRDVEGSQPDLIASLSYKGVRETLPAEGTFPSMLVFILPKDLDIDLILKGAKCNSATYFLDTSDPPRISSGARLFTIRNTLPNGGWDNDRVPLRDARLVQLEDCLDGAEVELVVSCPSNSFHYEIINTPEEVSVTEKLVYENLLRHFGASRDTPKVPLAQGGLRRKRRS